MPITKQELAAKIWDAANKMRGKIEANDYKDFLLGFIFYKYVSEAEHQYILKNDGTDEDLKALGEIEDESHFISNNLGYYIPHKYLFSTWIEMGEGLTASYVNEALQNFQRTITSTYRDAYDGIFSALQNGFSLLGTTNASINKSIRDLRDVVSEIPMDEHSYDVLGYIYEFLIKQFASSAGKKGGEFYTPREVGIICARIIANHLKDKEHISIYDCCSGSCGLLLSVATEWEKYRGDSQKVDYYGTELINKTYSLGRMNMIMRGVNPANLKLRNGDTLSDDWPYFDEKESYHYLPVSAVATNPPYSISWDNSLYETDPRYKYGLAPKGKADYAFLLHCLYHLEDDGIMTIVLPHGVLFRGGTEQEIRKNLIENKHFDAIIGLPANCFFGTGIPTIIAVLRKNRTNDDVLFIDASQEFIKGKKQNELSEENINKIVKTYLERKDVDKYAHLATKQEIIGNDYNLNIPRYVDTSEPEPEIDLDEVYGNLEKIDSEIAEATEKLNAMLKTLGLKEVR